MKLQMCFNKIFLPIPLIVVLGLVSAGRVMGQAFTVLHHFTAISDQTNTDGAQPMGSVVFSNGKLYGTTTAAGPGFGGTVFAMNLDGTGFTNLFVFAPDASFTSSPNGAGPEGRLIVSNNILYGTTESGGASGQGVVFRVNTDGSGFTNIHNFTGGIGGTTARGGLVLAGNTLYGTTESGNFQNQGIIFAVNTDGSGFTNLHGFTASSGPAGTFGTNSDGVQPNRNLVLLGNTLYGTAQYGGTNGYGTVFSLNTNGGGFTTLYTFTEPDPINITNSDGANPSAGMLLSGNRLYGNTRTGGRFGYGTIFAINPDGSGFTNLYSLIAEDGDTANAGMLLASNVLYGVTFGTGTNDFFAGGAIFSVSTNGTGYQNFYEFSELTGDNTNNDGYEPWDSLIIVSNVLYGTTRDGGTGGEGTVFALDLGAATPPIQFTANTTNGSINLVVDFTAPDVDANGHEIVSWNWDFGDGGTSTEQNPTHDYESAGTYVVTLVATNIRGGTVMGVGPEVTALPITTVYYAADVTNGTAPLTVNFSADDVDTEGNPIATWHWDFGDGATGVGQFPMHTYNTAGDYTVTLVGVNALDGVADGSGPSVIGVTAPMASSGHTLLAYYPFDDGNLSATDFSLHNNDLGFPFEYNGGSVNLTEDALTPPDAVEFEPGDSNGIAYYYTQSSNLLTALSGSFSVSLWLKTTQVSGDDMDEGVTGNASILTTYEEFVVPMALTGHKLCFLTAFERGDALHSSASIDTGDYVHVVVTRDEATGEKKIYVNGMLDATGMGETGILPSGVEMEIGAGNGTGFQGDLDDIQIYAGVLSAGEVSQLYNNPGTTIPDGAGGGLDLGTALNATNLVWTTSGDSDWFGETATNFDGVSAAQSGEITDSQANWIETTVPADGQVSFYWKVSSEQDFDFLTFYINGVQQDAISGEVDWTQDTFNVSAGDTLRWEYRKDDSNSRGVDAGWVDEVQYALPTVTAPVQVTFNLQVVRFADLDGGGFDYEAFPTINFIDPVPITTNSVVSPDGVMLSEVWAGDSSSDNQNGEGFSTLDDLIFACTNAPWTLSINKGDPSERDFTFNISVSGLTTNVLAPVTVLVPTPRATGVATNSPFQWTGPIGFSSVFVEAYQSIPTFAFDGFASLAGDATNWPSSPALLVGTNQFLIEYESNNIANFTFSTPVDGSLTPIESWNTEVDMISEAQMSFVVGGGALSAAELFLQATGPGNIGFAFQTANGQSETIQASTNLVGGGWLDLTNFMGDGSTRQFTFPTTNAPGKFFRVKTQ